MVDSIVQTLRDIRHWFETQRKVISKGGPSSWDMLQCDEQMAVIDGALDVAAGLKPDHVPPAFHVGVAADGKGAHISIMQRMGIVTHVVYAGHHPLGDTASTFTAAARPVSGGDRELPTVAQEVAEERPTGQVYGIIDPDYGRIYTMIRKLAWEEGYAIGLHGSFTRDLDLIAVPWDRFGHGPEHLVRRIIQATGLQEARPGCKGNPGEKPHGRLVWTLLLPGFGDPRFVDLSIMPPSAPSVKTDAARDVLAERQRQMDVEGWTPEHDDGHNQMEMALAAVCYALPKDMMTLERAYVSVDVSGGRGETPVWRTVQSQVPKFWPTSWEASRWKPQDDRRDLVRAGALILAEIERLDRAALKAKP